MRKVLAAMVLASALGCAEGGGVTEPPVSLTGGWAGDNSGVLTTATLVQTGSSVSGTGYVSGFGLSTNFTATGSHILQSVVLTLTSPTYGTFLLSATRSGNTITGVLTSANYPDLPVTMVRQ